ncbi:ribonuclease H-like domain-containing protein [Tanacetum coccineum]
MSVHDDTDNEFVNDFVDDPVTLISRLDMSNPLHLRLTDFTALIVVSIKLKGTKNYQVWSCAMLLALEGKNKISFIDGSCRRSNNDEVLGRQAKHVWEELKETYDKVDGSITFGLHHKIHTLRQNGSSIADYYHRLNALWKQFDFMIELPRCTCHAADDFKKHNQLMKLISAYATISSEESYIVAFGSSVGSSKRNQASAFVSNMPNRNNFQRSQNINNGPRPNNVNNNRQNRGAIQHMTYTDKELDNVLDISHLKIKVGHPNGTEDYIYKIGNLRLSNGLTLYDVMVIPEYCVTLISDLNLKNVLGIGEQCEGLYYYNDKGSEVGKNNSTNVFQDINHINFFDIEYLEIPNDDERVANDLNKGKSDSSSSSVSGSNVNTVDFSRCDSGMMLEPKSYFEASKYSHWTDAMNQEIDALLRTGTWELVDLPEGRKVIGCKWIYKIKFRSSGEIDRYKVDLLIKVLAKGYELNYEEAFSPRGQNGTGSVFIVCLAVSMSWHVFQLDVNNSFLYGDLEEVVFIKPPERYFSSDNKSKSDYSLYTKYDKGVFLALLVYVDDIIITGLGIHITKTSEQNTLSKSSTEAKYRALASVTSEVIWILKILKDLQIENLLPVSLHCDSNSAIKISYIITKGLDTIQHLELVKNLFSLVRSSLLKMDIEESLRTVAAKFAKFYVDVANRTITNLIIDPHMELAVVCSLFTVYVLLIDTQIEI